MTSSKTVVSPHMTASLVVSIIRLGREALTVWSPGPADFMNNSRPPSLRQIPSGIWCLGFVSLLMDISSDMIHSLCPYSMVTTLGAGTIAVGVVEGLAESLALGSKFFRNVERLSRQAEGNGPRWLLPGA